MKVIQEETYCFLTNWLLNWNAGLKKCLHFTTRGGSMR